VEYDQPKRSSGENREVDQTNSPEAIDRLSKIVDECLKLALRTGKPDVIEVAESAFSMSVKSQLRRSLKSYSSGRCATFTNRRASLPRPARVEAKTGII
jgi:hypothetical protein